MHPVLDMEIMQVRQKFGHNSIENRFVLKRDWFAWCHTGLVVSWGGLLVSCCE